MTRTNRSAVRRGTAQKLRTASEERLSRRLARLAAGFVLSLRPRRTGARIAVSFVPNGALRRLKREHLGKDVPFVDVLAFPAPKAFPRPDEPKGFLGDVYLNRAFLRRPAAELIFMLIHGTLHLLGYRHARKHDRIRMERLEDRLVARFRFSGRTFRLASGDRH